MTANGGLGLGVACGIAAGALWGLVFLAPELAGPFTALQLSAARYLAYGLFAAILIAPRWREIAARLGRAEWRALAWLSLLGNILYYILLASAVRLGGVSMTSLVLGFLPVVVTIIGSRDADAVALRRLVPSLLLGAGGILCIAFDALIAPDSRTVAMRATGLLCAIGALASWTTYAVGNSRWLARLDHVSVDDWNLLTGVVTGAQALLLIPPAMLIGMAGHSDAEWLRFLLVSTGVALFASIIGNSLWNRMTRLLPLTLVGQMIVFETIFALFYGFLWEQRFPTMTEVLAIILVAASVLSCLSAHRTRIVHA